MISRRRLMLGALAASLVAPRASAQAHPGLAPTPADAEGPFYPVRRPADRDFDLTQVDGHAKAAQGTRLYLSGTVRDTTGAGLEGATVELWQCDATGHYHHVDGDRPGDPDFQGYGAVTTDASGRYRFKTIRPVAYASRPPHLHFKLAYPGALALTTQLYVRGDVSAGDPVLGMTGRSTRERLTIVLRPLPQAEPGALAAAYDFVLKRKG